jgi:type I site-specific restriction endonuclease
MSELAKKVGSMRDRWKALDSLSGAAPKSLWERFDAACTAAYAPAAAHFRHLADERHANAARGQALVDEAQAEIARLRDGSAEWKHVAGTVQRLRLAWSHLGAIDRKEKKRLDAQFTDALNVLQGPLEEQRKAEMAEREAIIEEAAAIDPHDRHAIDAMRALQQRWQEHARALPLERKSEQALWQRFRAVCDDVFQRRKETMHEADIERRAHEAAKEAISARLEAAAADVTPAAAAKLLREAQAEWQAIGPVPRAHEARVEKRFHAAVAHVQQHVDQARRAAGVAQAGMLRDKLRLVQEVEDAVASAAAFDTDWEARWTALPALDAEMERVLRTRFDAALAALLGSPEAKAAYARELEDNRVTLLHDLLRLEIGAGIDSGPEFARERLKLQVEVLQSSLKAGHGAGRGAQGGAGTRLRDLYALPALVDARTASRIEQLALRLAKEGK